MEIILERGTSDVDGKRNIINWYSARVQEVKLKKVKDKGGYKRQRAIENVSELRIEEESNEDGGIVNIERDVEDGLKLTEKQWGRVEATLEEYRELF